MAVDSGNVLTTADQINIAFLNQLQVEVWQDDILIDSGIIEKHIKDAVKINGMYYVKRQNDFRLR